MKFLIDECLSPKLVRVANARGFEAYHVAHRGWSGESDSKILRRLVAADLILVTNNRDDFLALIKRTEIHPGIIVIVENVRSARQVELFETALEYCGITGDLTNTVVEVGSDGAVLKYHLPAG